MKRFFFALLCALASVSGFTQVPQNLITNWWPTYNQANYPYLLGRVPQSQPTKDIGIQTEKHIEAFFWRDLQGTIKHPVENEMSAALKMQPQSGAYYLIPVNVGDYVTSRIVLATYTPSGAFIDQLEAGVVCEGYDHWLYTKQCRVDQNMKVTIYHLRVTNSNSIDVFGTLPATITAQRIDTTYQITSDGHFQKIGEKKYHERLYTKAELNVKDRNIWDGSEVPLP